MPTQQSVAIDLRNVQDLVVRPYGYYLSRHLFFQFQDSTSGKKFLYDLLPEVALGVEAIRPKPERALNIGLTYLGLQALAVEQEILNQFPADFIEGPEFKNSAADEGKEGFNRMMDLGENAPGNWWHQKFHTNEIHCLVHIYANSDNDMAQFTGRIRGFANTYGIRELIPTVDGTPLEGRSLGEGRVHFNYKDGIAQPQISWDDAEQDSNKVNFRQFVLGYATNSLISKPSPHLHPKAGAFVKDSSYLVFRWMYQDVAAFNRFLRDKSNEPEVMAWARQVMGDSATSEDARELIAAKLIGRWRNGTPLALSPNSPTPQVDLTQSDNFKFAANDPMGLRCPVSAHIRVTNPRDQKVPLTNRVPRLLRRGHPYGLPLMPEDSTIDDGVDRGLIGMFICSNIREQFYKIAGWMQVNDFSNVFNPNPPLPQDPLFGNRAVKNSSTDFLIPHDRGTLRLTGLPNFVKTRGTVFCLLPSWSTLKAITDWV